MKTKNRHSITIIGNPDDGFTSAEIYDSEEKESYLGRVFELDQGWYVELDDLTKLKDTLLTESILEAKDKLLHYVNRKGAEFPEDATRAEISLWLMQRDDDKGFTIEDDGSK